MFFLRAMMRTFDSPRWSLERWILLYCSLALIELSDIFRDVADLQLIHFSLFALIILEFTSMNTIVVILDHMITQWGFLDFLTSRLAIFREVLHCGSTQEFQHADMEIYELMHLLCWYYCSDLWLRGGMLASLKYTIIKSKYTTFNIVHTRI